ncbi:MAG: hypothetical protein LUH53_11720 [Lachnospiraceae bacterium]|nr:hypothetical protein [Lachnospiraceae bacterium]
MQVEVPLDMYDDAVEAMRRRIERNEVSGVTNPDDAEKLVKKGHYTYAQAKQIAQAGTIESLYFDAANGMIIAKNAMGITAIITFAASVWNGDDIDLALENAVMSGLKVGGVSFLTTVISSQIARTSVYTSVRVGTDYLISRLGPKATAQVANALRSGTNIYGAAAMNNVSKLLAGNLIASAASLVVLSAGDVVDAFRGRISGGQLAKNVTVTGTTIAGGNAGLVAGSAAGAAIGGAVAGVATGGAGAAAGAEIGSKVGGFVGSVAGGVAAGTAAHAVMDEIIEDDAVKMLRLVEREFVSICEQYLLTENEVYSCLPLLKERLTKKELKNIYASANRELYIQSIILQIVNPVLAQRQFVDMPDADQILYGFRSLVEDAVNGTGVFDDTESSVLPDEQRQKLSDAGVREDQIPQVMQPVIRMNQTQKKVEHALVTMKRHNEDTEAQIEKLREERESLKAELNSLL